jgi:hypothetical protein
MSTVKIGKEIVSSGGWLQFAEQEMHVLGHDYAADDDKAECLRTRSST